MIQVPIPHLPASYFLSLLIFSALVSTVFATLLRDELAGRLRLGALLFGAFVLCSMVVGWVMYPFPS